MLWLRIAWVHISHIGDIGNSFRLVGPVFTLPFPLHPQHSALSGRSRGRRLEVPFVSLPPDPPPSQCGHIGLCASGSAAPSSGIPFCDGPPA